MRRLLMPLLRLRHAERFTLSKWIAVGLAGSIALALAGCSANEPYVDATIEVTGAVPSPNAAATRDQELRAVYADAKNRDVSALLALATQLPAPTPTPAPVVFPTDAPSASASGVAAASGVPFSAPTTAAPTVGPSSIAGVSASPTPTPTPVPRYDPAIALGLYYANPATYADTFVASYPSDPDGVMHDYGTRWVAAHVVSTGALFPIRALATLASSGNERALARLYDALPASRGTINAAYGRAIALASARDPARAFEALALADPAARLDVLAAPIWCNASGKKMLTASTSADLEIVLKSAFADRVRAACAPPRKVQRRAKHAGKKRGGPERRHAAKKKG